MLSIKCNIEEEATINMTFAAEQSTAYIQERWDVYALVVRGIDEFTEKTGYAWGCSLAQSG